MLCLGLCLCIYVPLNQAGDDILCANVLFTVLKVIVLFIYHPEVLFNSLITHKLSGSRLMAILGVQTIRGC